MGKRRPDVPGWASLRSDESRDLMDQVDPSYKLQEAHEGNVFPLPIPSVGYDIGSLLYVSRPAAGTILAALEGGEERPDFGRLLDDFYTHALEALRTLTAPDAFIFALDCEGKGYLFWPHRAVPGEPWPLRVPGPEACY